MTRARNFKLLILCLLALALAAPAWARDLWGAGPTYQLAAQLEQKYGLSTEPELQARLEHIGERLHANTDIADHPFRFAILNDKSPNALALPYGMVYVNKGTFQLASSEDELAFVVGHEISHITQDHARKSFQKEQGMGILLTILTRNAGFGTQLASQLGELLLSRGYSRSQEREADEKGIALMARSGYDARAAVTFMEKLGTNTKKGNMPTFLQNHPSSPDRVAYLTADAAKLPFQGAPAGRDLAREAHPKILVFPFATTENVPGLGRYLADRLATDMLKNTSFTVVEASPDRAPDPSRAREAAAAAGADYYTLGSVTQWNVQPSRSGLSASFNMDVPLYDASSGLLVQTYTIPVNAQDQLHSNSADFEARVLVERSASQAFSRQMPALAGLVQQRYAARSPIVGTLQPRPSQSLSGMGPGQVAPDLALPAPGRQTMRLSSYDASRAVLVFFWNEDTPQGADNFRQLQRIAASRPQVPVLAIHTGTRGWNDALIAWRNGPSKVQVALDKEGNEAARYAIPKGGSGLLLLGPHRRISNVWIGPQMHVPQVIAAIDARMSTGQF